MKIPNHYSLHSENDSHFVVHDKRDGKTFNIAKKDLHPAHQIKVMKMQKLAEGGEAEPNQETDLASTPYGKLFGLDQSQPAPLQSPMPVAQPKINVTPEQIAQPNPNPQVPGEAAQPEINMNMPSPEGMQKAFGAMESANTKEGNIQAQGQNDIAKAHQDYQKQMSDFNYQANQESWNKKVELDNMMQEMQSQKIDPNRLWHNMSTGSKIGTAISLVLGGIGAGASGGPNQAMAMIDKLMNQDMEAQKTNIANKNNLYSLNLKRYGDQQMADQATRLQMTTALQSQIASSAAKTNSPLAKIMAEKMNSQIKLQKAQYLQSFGQNAVMNKAMSGPVPLGQEPAWLLANPKYSERRVIVNNMSYPARGSGSDAEKLRVFESKLQPISSAINRLSQLGSEAAIPGTKANNEAHSIRASLATSIAGLKSTEIGSTRINNEEAQQALESIKDPTSWKQMLNGDIRNQTFFKDLEETAESVRHQNLMGYKGMSSLKSREGGWKK